MARNIEVNKVSRAIKQQVPEFIDRDHHQFVTFLEYYYKSQEKTGLSYNILNNLANYLDIDEYDLRLLEGGAYILEDISATDTTIVVEDVYGFVENNGTIKIGDEIIFYEKATKSPNVAITDGISYDTFRGKWIELVNLFNDFDSSTVRFPLKSGDQPISPPTAEHLVVATYEDVLIPGVDYTVDGTDIVFTQAPRTATPSDSIGNTYIFYLKGFAQNTIITLDSIQSQFNGANREFALSRTNGNTTPVPYRPVITEYTLVIQENRLLTPNVDYSIYESTIIFKNAPPEYDTCHILSLEAPIPSFGSGAAAITEIDNGQVSRILVKDAGSGYRIQNPPKVTIGGGGGFGATAVASVSGVSKMRLLDGGRGYSSTNPPTVVVEDSESGTTAKIKATVEDGSVTALDLLSSGSNYTVTPRVSFIDPGGATISTCTVSSGEIVPGSVSLLTPGQGYSVAPIVYVDEPTGPDPIQAQITTTIDSDGKVNSVTVNNPGRGYLVAPRIAIIDPTQAQILEVRVDNLGRVIAIDILSGGVGFVDVPSIYIVDNRKDGAGNSIGGAGATATASIFNGEITDINITNFGSGYDAANPPTVYIQRPPEAKASVEISFSGITGFEIIESGRDFSKSQFEGCARGVAGPIGFDSLGNLKFRQSSTAVAHTVDEASKADCLDGLFLKKMLTKFVDQFMPDLPYLDFAKIDVNNVIKNIRDFYQSKGTSQAIAYLFKILYGEQVDVEYPREQIIKPSDATWSVDTIVRTIILNGSPEDLRDSLVIQEADPVDGTVKYAQALVENYLTIQTSEYTIYELILAPETIGGKFSIPYKTLLVEAINATDGIITVDSTVGWPERNGEIIVGNELIRYKEKSLNQFIECTRSVNGVVEDWDAGTQVKSNFQLYANKGTPNEVQLEILGIAEAGSTVLTDTGSYYLSGDKLTVSKLGSTGERPQLDSWVYNVKKLVGITSIQGDSRVATAYTDVDHGLLVGDNVTIYGANPVVYNGQFQVIAINKTNKKEFQYETLTDTGNIPPQGTILASIDLNKGKSDEENIFNQIKYYTTNIQNTFFNDNYVYIASTGLPNYNIGPFGASALIPGNQRKLNRFPLNVETISTKTNISPGPVGTFVNGVSVWSYKSTEKMTYGPVTSISVTKAGSDYDADNPPVMTISTVAGQSGTDAKAKVVIDGSLTEIEVIDQGSGYTKVPLVSIVGGGGVGAAATAIVTQGRVSQILVTSPGTGYTSRPVITISGGGGSGATAEAKVRGPIKQVNVSNGGQDYTSKPIITLSSGTGAVAQAIVNNGRIISIAVINAGQGYTTAPNVIIGGSGFGAVARAVIDTDGENAGRVTSIQILNKGIAYTQGTTTIDLVSVGEGAEFDSEVFQWTYNLRETAETDAANGGVFSGYNNQYGGEYGHLSNPQRLRYVLGDNIISSAVGALTESENVEHSPIIGWAFDGNPIYGPYGYDDPTDQGSEIQRVVTSYRLKSELVYNSLTNTDPVRTSGPPLAVNAAGQFIEDYEYVFGLGDLDQYNGRFCKTPEYPDGTYAYFVTIDASENGIPQFPYILGPSYNSIVDTWNLNRDAVQQNIPEGVIRFRDPYENVDIDVERSPNVETDSLTTEDGLQLLFEPMDDNGDGVISGTEITEPNQILEESKLELFDYFPKVSIDSRVDIEVETTTKFEDAKVTGFIVENPGANYQVNDRLIFDNTDTDGSGASAVVSTIRGKTISSYNFETINDTPYGVITTADPHEINIGDKVQVGYNAQLDDSNKRLKVRVVDGIERLTVTQTGTGYNDDVPIEVQIDGDGNSAVIQPVINPTTGAINEFNILNSGSNFTSDPRIIVSHPQILKKTDYYITSIDNQKWARINDTLVTDSKATYICGETLNASGETCGFVAKMSATGAKQWEKTYSSSSPASGGVKSCTFKSLAYYNNRIYVVGETTPNATIQNLYNPDIIFCRFDEAADGLSASLGFQKGIGGISGATRADYVNKIVQYSDNRFVIGGYTNTNSAYPDDAYIALMSDTGEFVTKRKLSSTDKTERVVDIIVKDQFIYALMEIAPNASSTDTTFAIAKFEVEAFGITSVWTKEYTHVANWFKDLSFSLNEFDEFVVTAGLYDKTQQYVNAIWLAKFDIDATEIWNYRHPIIDITSTTIASITGLGVDIFGECNVLVTIDKPEGKRVDVYKFGYDGKITKHSKNVMASGADGVAAFAGAVDNSGDVYISGQSFWNRNEFVLEFVDSAANPIVDRSDTFTASTTDTPTLTQTNTSGAVNSNRLKLYGKESSGSGSYAPTYLLWDNSTYALQDAFGDGKDFTLEFFAFLPSARSTNNSQTNHVLVAITEGAELNGGIMLMIDQSTKRLELYAANNTQALNSVSPLTGPAAQFLEDRWHHVALVRTGDNFKVFFNGTESITGNTTNVSNANRNLYFGNVPGIASSGVFEATLQFSGSYNYIKLRNRSITSFTMPSDLGSSTSENYAFTDLNWLGNATTRGTYLYKNDDIPYIGVQLKIDKNNDSARLGQHPNLGSNFSGFEFTRTATTSFTIPTSLTSVSLGNWTLGSSGLQLLDFDNSNVTNLLDGFASTYANDIWSSRTATVPAPGSAKVKVTASVLGKFFIKQQNTVKIDNILRLSLNQPADFTAKTKLELRNRSTLVNNNLTAGTFINSAYIVSVDKPNNWVYVAINNNDWSDDLAGNYELSTTQFDEEGLDITGPVPNDVNQIKQFEFPQVTASTPGTFQFDMSTVSYSGGTLDQFARFYNVSTGEAAIPYYSLRIDEVSGSAAYVKGSVISIPEVPATPPLTGTVLPIAYNNTSLTDITISGITGVTKATLFCTLEKVIKPTAAIRTDDVYVVTSNRHYLSAGDMLFVEGNPSRTVNSVQIDEYDGSFPVDRVIGTKEFVYKLPAVAQSNPADSNYGAVEVYAKSPVIKMYYGHQYEFDVSHTSMNGYFLSFSKDNLNKLEYSFNSILRTGLPGGTGATVAFRVTQPEITNISYYFDPSRIGANSPVNENAYLDVVDSPYLGEFTVGILAGATITRGPDVIKFPLANEPEGAANVNQSSYTTSATSVVGQIGNIRIVNPGGFYRKLPIVSNIISSRKIERVNIVEPGTEYKVGVYYSVPIQGDGDGGLVQITVTDGEDAEGETIPGQISSVIITSAGKGYTTATIDIEAIPDILGPGLTGSGAQLEVEIPPFGSGASIFTKGANVGKIKKLKNNNFGYDYPHDYTLRPEITFPINAQLINTSVLRSITVTDPGSGYSQPPTVIIEGGGGAGAIAEATIKNGRIDQIFVKDPGAGYSSEPVVSLKSSFNYVVNLDLGLLQFSYPHGIANGSQVQLQSQDDGDDEAAFPIAAGATGTLNASTTYYAITGSANSLEDDQLKLAITSNNAELGDALTFVNAGSGRQILLTDSFGGAAEANVGTGEFLAGEEIYQGEDVNNPTAIGYVSENDGWLVGPRLLKLVDYTGVFELNEKITGKISKSSGIIADLSTARGVLDIDSITRTTGQFVDDVGKLSEIIQKVQDSYFYQSFSYVVQSSVSIDNWRELVTTNCHPAGFKLFGELNLSEQTLIENRKTDFELTKSVNLSDATVVPNIQNFALVEPIYTQYNNTEVLFRQRRLTSSENILTSSVQRLDDISNLFDGERISFPLAVNQEGVSASADQMMIVLNGVVQNPGTSFSIQGSNIVFAEPPQPAAMVRYANIEIDFLTVYRLDFSNVSGIFPTLGNTIVGLTTGWRGTVIRTSGNSIDVIWNGLADTALTTNGGLQESTATEAGYQVGETFSVSATGFLGILSTVTQLKDGADSNDHLFAFGETITNLGGEKAKIEEINLSVGQQSPIAKLRYTIGTGSTTVEVISYGSTTQAPAPPPAGTFVNGVKYQFGSEIFEVSNVQTTTESTILTVLRGQSGTAPAQQQEGGPVYSTVVEVTQDLSISKTTGTYQSTPGLLEIAQYDIIVGLSSGVVSFITRSFIYTDEVTNTSIPEVVISEGSTFFGLLFNRISNATYPNVVLDNVADSQIQINDFATNLVSFDSNFPGGESVNNYVLEYNNATNPLVAGENIRNYRFEYGNESGPLAVGETAQLRQLALSDFEGDGFFSAGQIIRSENAKAEVLGYNAGEKVIYLGKTGRGTATGEEYHTVTLAGTATLGTTGPKFGLSSLTLDGTAGCNAVVPSSSDFAFGTNGFITECWIYPETASLTGQVTILDMRASAPDTAVRIYIDNAVVTVEVNGATVANAAAAPLSAGSWYHIAYSRASNNGALFIDGVNRGNGTDNTSYPAKAVTVGTAYDGTSGFIGKIDEVMIRTDTTYSSNFTPSTGIYQGVAGIKLLLHFEREFDATTTLDWSGAATWTQGNEFVNSGIKFRFYDAANQVESNIDLIAAEAVYRMDRNFPRLHIPAPVANNKGADAHDLILSNLNFIANEAYERVNPTPPGGTTAADCIDDVKDVVRNIAYNLKYGFNSKTWDAAELYTNGTTIQHLSGNETDSVNVFNQARDIAKQVINNTTVTISGSHGLTQTTDATITYLFGGCVDQMASIDTLMKIVTDTVMDPDGNDAANYPSSISQVTRTHPNHAQCTLDTKLIVTALLSDVRNGGNAYIWDAAAQYVNRSVTPITLNHIVGEEAETIWAIDMANTIAKEVMRRDTVTIQGDHGLTQVVDNTITTDSSSPYCADVATAMDNLILIITNTLDQAYVSAAELVADPNAVAVDYLGTITRTVPTYAWAGGKVYAYRSDDLTVRAVDTVNDYFYVNEIYPDSRYRYIDAADLIEINTEAIVDETAGRMLARYPSLATEMPRNGDGTGAGTDRCKTDLTLLLNAIIKDLKFGGNKYTTEGAKFYLGQNDEIQHVRLQLYASLFAHETLGEMAKLAITGDLEAVTQYTDAIVISDIGITQDAGNCANVKTTIDNLITNMNTIISPVGDRYVDAADLLKFNKQYITEEAIGLMEEEFFYQLSNGVQYQAFTYPGGSVDGRNKCIRDAGIILEAVIADLLTGGNNSSLRAVEEYLNSQLEILHVEDQLTATLYAFEQVQFLAKKAVANLLQTSNNIQLSNDHYVAQYTTREAFVDTTITHDQSGAGGNYSASDCADVQSSIDNLFTVMLATLAPGGDPGRAAAQMILFNKNYYNTEIEQDVINQWGSTAWNTTFDSFIEQVVDDVIHDMVLTDISTNPASTAINNTQTLNSIRSLNVSSDLSAGLNLIPANQTEEFTSGTWNAATSTDITVTANSATAPDGTTTADLIIPANNANDKALSRSYVLTAYTTFDRDNVTFDSDANSFDEGVDISAQRYTFSIFFKAGGNDRARIRLDWDGNNYVFFTIDLTNGNPFSVNSAGIVPVATGVFPQGGGWYRAFITADIPFGVSSLNLKAYGTSNGSTNTAGNGTDGVYMWGAKLNRGDLDVYEAQGGTSFFPDNSLNIRSYILEELDEYMRLALAQGLVTPSPITTFLSFTDATLAARYTAANAQTVVTALVDLYENQLTNNLYYTTVSRQNNITLQTKTFGTRNVPVPLGGEIRQSSFIYGLLSDNTVEVKQYNVNEAEIATTYLRMRISNINDGPFILNDTVQKQGDTAVTGTIYSFWSDENFSYWDVVVTGGTWAAADIVVSNDGAYATVDAITPRLHLIGLQGSFVDGVNFKGYTSGNRADTTAFIKSEAAVLSNTGGKLTVDTDSLVGPFETTSVVYPESSRLYVDINQFAGLELNVGERIVSDGYVRYGVTVQGNLNQFAQGGILYGVSGGVKDTNRRAVITEVDLDNGYIYAQPYLGTFNNGDGFAYYGPVEGEFPVGYAIITTSLPVTGNAAARVVDIKTIGLSKRVFLEDIRGTWSSRETLKARGGYRAQVQTVVELKARVKRSFRGFDSVQTTFKLTTANGTPYFPDPEGHMLIFINGILQPPGSDNAYTAFSDNIQFQEAPEVGASFVGVYLGKLRQLDDISFEFDSLRQSFNLRRSGTFYSLTLTDGVQSSVVRPENNIIVSLNGVIQEPGVAFNLVGSRIIFAEVPRVGSTFVAFSYVGSEADVDAEIVIPPIEPGDFIDIQGETEDREVAVIESSNSLITFDYLGSVFGKDAAASVDPTQGLTIGSIREARVTAGGSGYTSRPLVRIDSTTGDNANIKALVGVERIELTNRGSGYKYPEVEVQSVVDDNYVAPNLSIYPADATPTPVIDALGAGGVGSGIVTETEEQLGVNDNTNTTSGGTTAGSGISGATSGGTAIEELETVPPSTVYNLSGYVATNIWSSSST